MFSKQNFNNSSLLLVFWLIVCNWVLGNGQQHAVVTKKLEFNTQAQGDLMLKPSNLYRNL